MSDTKTSACNMDATVTIQYAVDNFDLPDEKQLRFWINMTLRTLQKNADITLRIVGDEEGTVLNERWRNRQGVTNVLSFAYDKVTETTPEIFGDIVICAPLVAREAKTRQIDLEAHWAHLVIHGVLHLCGFDHVDRKDAEKMEALEIKLLKKSNYKNPYLADTKLKSP